MAQPSLEDRSTCDLLSDPLLVHIFSFLPARNVAFVGRVSKRWYRITNDDIIWKKLFYRDWKISRLVARANEKDSWKQEYIRLQYNIPRVQSEILTEHSDKVLHVSYSHNGKMFATSSVDGSIKLWNSDYPATIRCSHNMKQHKWVYVHHSKFNRDDTHLLVSGVCVPNTPLGQIMVLDVIKNEFVFETVNSPFNAIGTWYDNTRFFSNGRTVVCFEGSVFIMSTIFIHNIVLKTHKQIFRFFHKITVPNLIRNIMVADCDMVKDSVGEGSRGTLPINVKYFIFVIESEIPVPHQIGIKRITSSVEEERARCFFYLKRGDMFENQENKHEKMDLLIDFHANISGTALSPDGRYVYVNIRPWPENYIYIVEDLTQPPPTSEEMEIRVIDLFTLNEVGTKLRSHKSFTNNDKYCSVNLDISKMYIASGSSENCACLWERNYGIYLNKFPHEKKVSSVAFNSSDSETLITVSHDSKIKVWRSQNRMNEIKANNLRGD